ncbi:hypothetical protein [Gorillibacterium sp. CAU 1737]|uniref:hypothetical protein n=1 Tax=Gorillibacterium sp. CAU 1737 TaxID=3140362 RepID=UPI00326092FB
MRMSGFIAGAIVGAFATRYVMRGGKFSWLTPNMAWIGGGTASKAAADKGISGGAVRYKEQGEAGLGKVSELLNQDPEVKAQVNEILRKNSEKSAELH